MAREKEAEIGGIIIAICIVFAIAVQIAKALLPWFILLALVSFVASIVILILSIKDICDPEWALWSGGAFLLFSLLSLLALFVGYGLGESELGQAAIEVADAFNLIKEVEKNATLTIIDATQQATSEIIESTNSTNDLGKTINTSYDLMRIAAETG